MWKNYLNIRTIDELLENLSQGSSNRRIIAGGTDLMLECERGMRPEVDTLLDISRIPELNRIWQDAVGIIHIGALVTHNDIVSSDIIRQGAIPLQQACWQIGSPQIRNRGTVVGNLVTASPANDTITPLIALDATLVLVSKHGDRLVKLADFYRGVRKTELKLDEFVKEIIFPTMQVSQKGTFIKSALRRAQAISVLNCAIILDFENGIIKKAMITLGAVAPTIIHAVEAETYLVGRELTDEVILQVAKLTSQTATPISDIRGSDQYRTYMVEVITKNALIAIKQDNWQQMVPSRPILLDGDHSNPLQSVDSWDGKEISTTINGKSYHFTKGLDKTLLDLIREEAGLTGTKEGCGEGECGACTVYLDGKAVMSCLVPAPRAHNAQIVTIEGIQNGHELHPVQQAFIDYGAVQCGYCTPGFIMSAVKLLAEKPLPSQDEVKQAITGNLCRCTGYYKIVQAIEAASVQINERN